MCAWNTRNWLRENWLVLLDLNWMANQINPQLKWRQICTPLGTCTQWSSLPLGLTSTVEGDTEYLIQIPCKAFLCSEMSLRDLHKSVLNSSYTTCFRTVTSSIEYKRLFLCSLLWKDVKDEGWDIAEGVHPWVKKTRLLFKSPTNGECYAPQTLN